MKRIELLACFIGIIIGGVTVYYVSSTQTPTDQYDTEYHIHADFKIYLEDKVIDLSADEYMTTATQELSDYVHLHDNDGDVEHIHLEGVTFSEFLNTIGLSLTNECLTLEEKDYCVDDSNILSLYVNDELYRGDIAKYIPKDEDRILVFYGNTIEVNPISLLETVNDDACYFSGTCPERGIAPPESCGLTCEL